MGKDFKFIHCADLHLGYRFKGVESADAALASRLRESVFKSFERIVDRAVAERVDAVVISGDIYDDENASISTRSWFAAQLSRLGDVPVFVCKGNHDFLNRWEDAVPYPANVRQFSDEPETVAINEDVEIVGVSFSERHEKRNLVSMMSGSSDRFTIGCVHCNIESVSEGYSYAPCAESDFVGRSVDYWALGHIHKRQVVRESPHVVYPGNIQGHSIKETGEKGAYLVTVSDRKVRSMEFIPTQTMVWKQLDVDIADRTVPDVISYTSSETDRDTICRIRFFGSGALDTALRTGYEDVMSAIRAGVGCIVSSASVETSPSVDLDERAGGNDMVGAVISYGRSLKDRPKEEIIDMICGANKDMAQYRDHFSGMSDEEISGLIEDSLRFVVAKMEAAR